MQPKVARYKMQVVDSFVHFHISDEDLQKFFTNKLTLRDVLSVSSEMWKETIKWQKLLNGHGVPGTHVMTWSPRTWADYPEDEKPSVDSYLRADYLSQPSV